MFFLSFYCFSQNESHSKNDTPVNKKTDRRIIITDDSLGYRQSKYYSSLAMFKKEYVKYAQSLDTIGEGHDYTKSTILFYYSFEITDSIISKCENIIKKQKIKNIYYITFYTLLKYKPYAVYPENIDNWTTPSKFYFNHTTKTFKRNESNKSIKKRIIGFLRRAKKSVRVYYGYIDEEGQKYVLVHIVALKVFRKRPKTSSLFYSPFTRKEPLEYMLIKI